MRPKTTGRFSTRRELLERVRFLWQETSCHQAAIARACQVSDTTIHNIIKDREWKKVEDWIAQEMGDRKLAMEPPITDEPVAMGEAIPTVHQESCGAGYMPDACRVHLDSRTLNELEHIE